LRHDVVHDVLDPRRLKMLHDGDDVVAQRDRAVKVAKKHGRTGKVHGAGALRHGFATPQRSMAAFSSGCVSAYASSVWPPSTASTAWRNARPPAAAPPGWPCTPPPALMTTSGPKSRR